MSESESIVKSLLAKAEITINGTKPWDIQIHDVRCYDRFLKDRSLGFGEAYMDGWWDAYTLDETVAKIVQAKIEDQLQFNKNLALYLLKRKMFSPSAQKHSHMDVSRHYDFGHELFEAMLDPDLNYSCGYWKNLGNPQTAWKIPRNLRKAQQAKLAHVCRKLLLKKGLRILDIGCGWGNVLAYATTHFGVRATGVTLSKRQASYIKNHMKGHAIKILSEDFREIEHVLYDRIVSIEMIEHLTYRYYALYFKKVASLLKSDGVFLLQTIGANKTKYANDPWVEKYIFPNTHIPSLAQIAKEVENLFVVEEVENFGAYYYPTLMSWFRNFHKNWKRLAIMNNEKYNDRFYRMWKFYLLASAGCFKAGKLQLWQIVFSKRNTLGVYPAL